ncbi:hypothetical protein [Streptomyces sp. NBC_00306]|uniref:hypothetical protein n=1 Tax=Streptomyces sp. NBC_00306 TaxID=2975708 RepID=UPI002E29E8CB|nr:hypothetical protein [Streptomyces sp. NBC_00306]
MTTYTGAVFNNGPVSRLLDLAVACRRDSANAALEDELARFCRTVRNSPETDWAMPVATVSALLDLLSDQLESGKPPATPIGFSEKLAEAAGDLPGPEFLRLLSGLLRLQERESLPDFDELPMAAWEAVLKFGRIAEFWWWVDSGEYEDFDEGVREGVASEHPNRCHQDMSALAAQVQEALLFFPTSQARGAGLVEVIPWASKPVLRAILDAVHVHFEEQH